MQKNLLLQFVSGLVKKIASLTGLYYQFAYLCYRPIAAVDTADTAVDCLGQQPLFACVVIDWFDQEHR